MKLYFSETSPYARKVRMVAHEKGLTGQIELVPQNPMQSDAVLTSANPLAKIPVLMRDDGPPVFDSAVICEYLNGLAPEPDLYGAKGDPIAVKTRTALADGIMDASFSLVMERKRDAAAQSDVWAQRWGDAIARSVDAADRDIASFEGVVTVDAIGLGAALGYLDFRLGDLDWRTGRPSLSAWYAVFSQRLGMATTAPPAG